MLVSDYSQNVYRTIKLSLAVLLSALGVVWINQHAFNEYWMLHFHRETPWENVNAHWWSYGATVGEALTSSGDTFLAVLSGEQEEALPIKPVAVNTTHCAPDILAARPVATTSSGAKPAISLPASVPPQPGVDNQPVLISVLGTMKTPPDKVLLPAGKKVLMIGDSMMEGVVPRLMPFLKKAHQVESINLSKRSTGLAYPSFFNWPKVTENALAHGADIGLLVVFMGPNDPWDMPSEQHKTFLKFKSTEWESEYRQRIDRILASAQQRNIPVIWALPPVMRKEKLNAGISYLDTLYSSEVSRAGGMTIDVNNIFGYKDGHYSPNAVIQGKNLRVRADDGIHYTVAGQNLIAQAILAKIQFPEKTGE